MTLISSKEFYNIRNFLNTRFIKSVDYESVGDARTDEFGALFILLSHIYDLLLTTHEGGSE